MYQSKKHRLSKRQAMDELKQALDNHWYRSKRTDMEAIRVASEIINSIEDVIGKIFLTYFMVINLLLRTIIREE